MQGLCVFCLFCFACSPNPVLFLHDNIAGFALGNDLADILTLSLSILLPFLVLNWISTLWKEKKPHPVSTILYPLCNFIAQSKMTSASVFPWKHSAKCGFQNIRAYLIHSLAGALHGGCIVGQSFLLLWLSCLGLFWSFCFCRMFLLSLLWGLLFHSEWSPVEMSWHSKGSPTDTHSYTMVGHLCIF